MKAILVFLLFIPGFCGSQSLMWEISGNGLQNTSYLYGTFHVKDSRVFRFADSVMINFNKCDAFAGEILMEKVNMGGVASMMLMPPDTTLRMLISKEDYDFVKVKAKEKLGMLAGMIDKIRPIYTSVLITEMDVAKDNKKDSTKTLDEYFQIAAKKKSKKVLGIETPEEQLAALNRISLQEQAGILVKSLKEDSDSDQGMEKMFEIYMSQDLEALQKYMEDYEMPDMFSKALLIDRNHVMSDRISKMIKEQPIFIGIGTAHLPGKEGVIELLRNNGFKVRPVIPTFDGILLSEELEDKGEIGNTQEGGWFYIDEKKEIKMIFPSEISRKVSNTTGKRVITLTSNDTQNQILYGFEFYKKDNPNQKANDIFKSVLNDYKKSDAKILKKKNVEYKKFPALELKIREGETISRIIYVVKGDKIYKISVKGSESSVDDETAKKFFNSLIFLKY